MKLKHQKDCQQSKTKVTYVTLKKHMVGKHTLKSQWQIWKYQNNPLTCSITQCNSNNYRPECTYYLINCFGATKQTKLRDNFERVVASTETPWWAQGWPLKPTMYWRRHVTPSQINSSVFKLCKSIVIIITSFLYSGKRLEGRTEWSKNFN